MSAALNVYTAITGYQSAAGRTVEWTKRNPAAWELVSRLIKERANGAQ